MLKTLFPFKEIPQLSKTDVAYSGPDPSLRPFFQYLPQPDSFRQALQNRRQYQTPREDLHRALKAQYAALPHNPYVDRQIDSLLHEDTFTVCTAHQPSLFLGPLYFIYKAVTTINLAEAVQQTIGPQSHIVPVFVLGSEDHDLDELNHIQLFNKELRWHTGQTGPVGHMQTDDLRDLLKELQEVLGASDNARYLFSRVERAYTQHATFGEATQAFLHDLMGRYGLVVLQMGDAILKRHFIPVMQDELLRQSSHGLVSQTTRRLEQLGLKVQAPPRDINLFYLQKGSRERIVQQGETYAVLNTGLEFSRDDILKELETHPEAFSPNVILRPLFQETILPNLAYVGGGGELAYWLERKDQFDFFKLHYPVLIRRNSVLWIDKDSARKMDKLGLHASGMFDDIDALIRRFVAENAEAEINLDDEMAQLAAVYNALADKAKAIDPTLEKAVRADEVRHAGQLQQWQSRLVRAEKARHEISINQIRALKDKLFPGGGLQERSQNFMALYLKHGEYFLDELKENLDPFEQGFVILEEP